MSNSSAALAAVPDDPVAAAEGEWERVSGEVHRMHQASAASKGPEQRAASALRDRLVAERPEGSPWRIALESAGYNAALCLHARGVAITDKNVCEESRRLQRVLERYWQLREERQAARRAYEARCRGEEP